MSVLAREDLLTRLRQLRPELEGMAVTGLALYGSRARGENRSDSDIDLLIEIDEARKFSLIDLVGIEQTLQERLGLPVDVKLRRSLSHQMRTSTASELVEIF